MPCESRETVLLDTVQFAGVMEAKVTVSPELAVAVRGSCVKAYCVPVMGGNSMFWPW